MALGGLSREQGVLRVHLCKENHQNTTLVQNQGKHGYQLHINRGFFALDINQGLQTGDKVFLFSMNNVSKKFKYIE